MHARLASGAAWLSLLLLLAAGSARADERRFQRVLAGDRKIGQTELTRQDVDGHIFETEQVRMELGRPGRHVTYRMTLATESTADGALVRMTREVNAREGHSLVEARVVGEDLEVASGAGRARTMQKFPGLGAGLKSDLFAQAWRAAVARGEALEPLLYASWDPVKLAVVQVELRPRSNGDAVRIERRVRSALQETATLQQLDASGNVMSESMRLGSLDLTLEDSSERAALEKNAMLDHVGEQLQKSPYRIPQKDMRAKIRYGFDNHGVPPGIPTGAGQHSWIDGQTTIIQVCAECTPDAIDLSPEERAHALEPTSWLQAGNSKLAARAQGIARGADDAALKMRRLTAFVRGHMSMGQIDMLGYGTALEAYTSRHGDCTEYAVLLATLGRAAGVPTRIAIGSVYARHFEGHRHVFVPHAWVQAWTGPGWQSFDAAIGTFDSTHLAFAVSYDGGPSTYFAATSLSHELTMRSAARVVPRKGAAR